jgi:hypothetical protein
MAGEAGAGQKPGRERGEPQPRQAFDKTQNAPRGGSAGKVLLVALLLVGAGAGVVYVGPEFANTYILALLAVLGTIGVL